MGSDYQKVLIVDDDPAHLDIYSLIVKAAGFHPVPLRVTFAGPDALNESGFALVLLDYRLNSVKTAPEIAQDLRDKFPSVPIVVLSDLWSMPADIAPYATGFVRKGEPEKLVQTMQNLLRSSGGGVALG